MGYDLGAVVPIAFTVRDAAGALTDATTVNLTVTLPDGTTANPSVGNPPTSTGLYGVDYVTSQPGRHVWRATTTGPTTAYGDVFHVHTATSYALAGLDEVKAHLNIDAAVTTHDAELRDAILTASDVVEGICGSIARRTFVENHTGRGQPGLVLRHGPVISVTEVTENGSVLAVDQYAAVDGVLYRASGFYAQRWRAGFNNIGVTYVAGVDDQVVPPAALDSVKELVRINFRPQLGGDYASPFAGDPGDDYDASAGAIRLGFFVPNKIVALLRPYADPGGFA